METQTFVLIARQNVTTVVEQPTAFSTLTVTSLGSTTLEMLAAIMITAGLSMRIKRAPPIAVEVVVSSP